MSSVVALLAVCVFALGMMYAFISDLRTMTISNRLVITLLVAYGILAPVVGLRVDEIVRSGLATTAVLAIGVALFAQGWIGGGDAKLASVVTLWVGAEHALTFLVLASFLGGVLTLVLLGFRRVRLGDAAAQQPWILRLHNRAAGVPYGIALALSALAVLPTTRWMVFL